MFNLIDIAIIFITASVLQLVPCPNMYFILNTPHTLDRNVFSSGLANLNLICVPGKSLIF